MKRPFLGWPGWPLLRFAGWISLINCAWFVLVYGGCDWITAHRALRVPIALPFERGIPFLPAFSVAYMSIYGLFAAGPFILRQRREVSALVLALAVCIGVGGIGFLLVPAAPMWPPPAEIPSPWGGWYRVADRLNLDYNLLPSLHVALSVCCAAAYARSAPRALAAGLWGWAGLIALSTLLTHQHQLADVAAGWALGLLAERRVFWPGSGRGPRTAAPQG